ncbi:MAG: nucleotidyltransferase family protein [Pseudomonadota bacterium]
MRWQALVLAGERPEGDPLAATEGVPAKAFIDIAGQPMIAHVLKTLSDVPTIETISVSVSPDAPALPSGPWRRLAAAPGPSASVREGFDALGGAPLLVTTADHPLLRPATVEDFLKRAAATGAAAIAGIARGQVAAQPPGAPPRTILRFRDGGVGGCNLFALVRPEASGVVDFWQRLEVMRKRPAALALAIGPLTAASFQFGRLTLANAEKALARKTGVAVATVMLDDPLALHDVDKPAHLAFARERLRDRHPR